MRRSRAVVYDIAHSNKWEWFFTLTLNGAKVDRFDYDKATKKVSKWLDNLRQRYCPEMLYLMVAELHKKGGWHFHGLFAQVEGLTFTDSGKRSRSGLTVYNVDNYRWGWSTATKVQDTKKASNYLLKYMTKELGAVTFGKKRYWRAKKCATPETQTQFLGAEGVALLRDTLADTCDTWKTLCSLWGDSRIQVMDIYQYENIKQG